MKHIVLLILLMNGFTLFAQQDSAKKDQAFKRTNPALDTLTNQDAIYDRPFITIGKTRTAVGGYVEGNTNYFSEDGVSEGFSMELRRFNIFLYSSIHPRIKFLSELEFEHGTEEIALETALLDFELHPALNFRAGILLPQIGLVNANHDSPKWEFVERPLSSTEIIPTTLSEIGFGFHGKLYAGNNIISYDAYLVNGLQDGVILNSMGKTHLASGKDLEMFGEDNNGTPMYNGRVAIANRKVGELGFGYYGGTYNTFRIEGTPVAARRNLSLFAVDFSTQIKKLKIQGEAASVNIDVPQEISEVYGTKQWGGFVDLVYPVMQRRVLKFDNAVLNVSLRAERIDYNIGKFLVTDSNIGDEVTALSLGIGLRPVPGTIIRANYRYHWIHDNLDNPAIHLGGIQVGVASYF
jgi:hypothetical protein